MKLALPARLALAKFKKSGESVVHVAFGVFTLACAYIACMGFIGKYTARYLDLQNAEDSFISDWKLAHNAGFIGVLSNVDYYASSFLPRFVLSPLRWVGCYVSDGFCENVDHANEAYCYTKKMGNWNYEPGVNGTLGKCQQVECKKNEVIFGLGLKSRGIVCKEPKILDGQAGIYINKEGESAGVFVTPKCQSEEHEFTINGCQPLCPADGKRSIEDGSCVVDYTETNCKVKTVLQLNCTSPSEVLSADKTACVTDFLNPPTCNEITTCTTKCPDGTAFTGLLEKFTGQECKVDAQLGCPEGMGKFDTKLGACMIPQGSSDDCTPICPDNMEESSRVNGEVICISEPSTSCINFLNDSSILPTNDDGQCPRGTQLKESCPDETQLFDKKCQITLTPTCLDDKLGCPIGTMDDKAYIACTSKPVMLCNNPSNPVVDGKCIIDHLSHECDVREECIACPPGTDLYNGNPGKCYRTPDRSFVDTKELEDKTCRKCPDGYTLNQSASQCHFAHNGYHPTHLPG